MPILVRSPEGNFQLLLCCVNKVLTKVLMTSHYICMYTVHFPALIREASICSRLAQRPTTSKGTENNRLKIFKA